MANTLWLGNEFASCCEWKQDSHIPELHYDMIYMELFGITTHTTARRQQHRYRNDGG